jgi:hypothetical protein
LLLTEEQDKEGGSDKPLTMLCWLSRTLLPQKITSANSKYNSNEKDKYIYSRKRNV